MFPFSRSRTAHLETRLAYLEAEAAKLRGELGLRLDPVVQVEQSASSLPPVVRVSVDQAGVRLEGEPAITCRWCGAVEPLNRFGECNRCGVLRPEVDEDDDEDVVFACERCGRVPAFADNGLCGKCDGRRVRT